MAAVHQTQEYKERMSRIGKENWEKRRMQMNEPNVIEKLKKENAALKKENKVMVGLKDENEKMQQVISNLRTEVIELRKKASGPSLERMEKMMRTSLMLSELDDTEQLLVNKMAKAV